MSTDKGSQIAKRNSDSIAKSTKNVSIGALEKSIYSKYPKSDQEPWDVSGLTVGEPSVPVQKVAVALDATVETIEKAADLGANVLVTHHPPFLEGPMSFGPGSSPIENPGCAVWAAITSKMALMNFHTCLDASRDAQAALPTILGLRPTGELLLPLATDDAKGYGAVCEVPTEGGEAVTLGTLSARCLSILGHAPKVWGDGNKRISSVAVAQGSASSIVEAAYEKHVDCIICGEMHYHDALDLTQAGLGIIELGHDVSEMPLVAVLGKAVADSGVSKSKILIIDNPEYWAYPEAIRL